MALVEPSGLCNVSSCHEGLKGAVPAPALALDWSLKQGLPKVTDGLPRHEGRAVED